MVDFPLATDPKAEDINQVSLEKCIQSAIGIDAGDIPQETQFGRKKIEDQLKKWEDE